ncbi:pyridoxamine 5'-phosphate oxidase [Vogesella fluminis]|uniref:Pyridoxamine 5'-phosphate oxidase n=2 Tax=Vogesella fluminis TaxID=1069161 RepID=A0ABQ3HD41_9NEIS|nr:pyridoxamine 5'-phosphate oxidase [Vogesella fluminis]
MRPTFAMNIPVTDCLSLLHRCSSLALATQSQALPGYPFVTVLPFALDAAHRPWLLMSELAEHCRNVRTDGRVSVLLQQGGTDVLQGERMTLVGDLQAMSPDAATQARLLRYCPAFADYLALGDFHFFCLQPKRLRFIGGFGRMGWIDAGDWAALPQLAAEQEQVLLAALQPADAALQLLGLDVCGLDVLCNGIRQRLDFAAPVGEAALLATAQARLAAG